MNQSFKIVVKNSKNIPQTQGGRRKQSNPPSLPAISFTTELQDQFQPSMEEKLQRLKGNLRMLQKNYRNNLKQGFEHKIKAYRLQAVIQRKMLKQAIEETKKHQQLQLLQQKMQNKEKSKSLGHSRIEIIKAQLDQRNRMRRERNLLQKKTIQLSLYQKKSQIQQKAKQSHDKIAEEEEHIDKKKHYLDFIRKNSIKKQQSLLKRQLLHKIINNTQKLRDLKNTLQEMKESTIKDDIFLTL